MLPGAQCGLEHSHVQSRLCRTCRRTGIYVVPCSSTPQHKRATTSSHRPSSLTPLPLCALAQLPRSEAQRPLRALSATPWPDSFGNLSVRGAAAAAAARTPLHACMQPNAPQSSSASWLSSRLRRRLGHAARLLRRTHDSHPAAPAAPAPSSSESRSPRARAFAPRPRPREARGAVLAPPPAAQPRPRPRPLLLRDLLPVPAAQQSSLSRWP